MRLSYFVALTLLSAATFAGAQQGVSVDFQRLQEIRPSQATVQRALTREVRSRDDRLALAYFQGLSRGTGEPFADILRKARASDFREETLEAIPIASGHFASNGDLKPAIAAMDLKWDGASAEGMADEWVWCATNRSQPFLTALYARKQSVRKRVLDLIGPSVTRDECLRQIKKAEHDRQPLRIKFWKSVLPLSDDNW